MKSFLLQFLWPGEKQKFIEYKMIEILSKLIRFYNYYNTENLLCEQKKKKD